MNIPGTELPMCPLHGHINNQTELKHGGEAGGFERTEVTYNIARLAVCLLLHCVEGLATQLGAAGHADEAVDMEDLVHGSAAGTFTHHILSTAGTAPWGEEEEGRLSSDSLLTHRYIRSGSIYQETKSHIPLTENTASVQTNHQIM